MRADPSPANCAAYALAAIGIRLPFYGDDGVTNLSAAGWRQWGGIGDGADDTATNRGALLREAHRRGGYTNSESQPPIHTLPLPPPVPDLRQQARGRTFTREKRMARRTQFERKPQADEGNVGPTNSALGAVDVVPSRVQLRPAAGTMLTFASASSPNLDAFFEIIVELLLERLEQLSPNGKEK